MTPNRRRVFSTVYAVEPPQVGSLFLNADVRVVYAENSTTTESLKFHPVRDARLEDWLVPINVKELLKSSLRKLGA